MGGKEDRDRGRPMADDCPLSAREQTRNLVLFGATISLIYLASSSLYVGLVQAALLDQLGASKTRANLPTTLYFWAMPLTLLVAWFFSSVRQLRPVLVVGFVVAAVTEVGVVITLLLPAPEGVGRSPWVSDMVLIQAALLGVALPVVNNYQWEVLGRGVSERRRGHALALAFGAGPTLAFLSSLGTQLVLDGKIGPLTIPPLAYPWNFAALFAVGVPAMLLAALLSTLFIIPRPAVEAPRQPFIAGVFGGIGEFFRYRLTRLGGIATFLVGFGYLILTNFTLFTKEAVGAEASEYVGYQLAYRFGFKVVAGLFLGWLLTRTHAKAGLLLTGAFCLASVVWILGAPGTWFLVSFGLMGAGELWGVYYPNYVVTASAKSRIRRNMSIVILLYMPQGFGPVLFGRIADGWGLRASFYAAGGVLAATLLFVQLMLPARPRPRQSDLDA